MPRLRLTIQLLFFALSLVVMLGILDPPVVDAFFNAFHLTTNLSAWIRKILTPFIWITLLLLVLPYFVGRVYCSFLCPVGFIQDLVLKISRRRRHRFGRRHIPVLLVATATLYLLFFNMTLIGYIDHISNYGRIFGLFYHFSLIAAIFVVVFLIIILLVPAFFPRWYCQNLCPSGALFQIFDKKKVLQVKITSACNKCGLCETSCPAGCIKQGDINMSLCINCFDCIFHCKQKAIKYYHKPWRFPLRDTVVMVKERRNLLKNGAVIALGYGVGLGGRHAFSLQSEDATSNMIVPPGAGSIRDYINSCSGCQHCTVICPTGVLRHAKTEYKAATLLKPAMDYNNSYCSYECNACSGVCPTNAISYIDLKQKKQTKIGSAHIDRKTCIPYKQRKDCAACAEHCPTGAITMHLRNGIFVPILKDQYCIGCGACQTICPVEPVRAITITPLAVHILAYTPVGNHGEKPKTLSEEFPF